MRTQLSRHCMPQEPPAVGEQHITRSMIVAMMRNCERRVQSCAISSTQNHRDEKKRDKGVASCRRHSAHNRPQCGRFTGDISDIFVLKALNFYVDYLAGQENAILPKSIQSAIDGRLGMFEGRMSRLLYKLTVEMDMGINAVLDCIQFDDEYLRRLRSDSVKNVKASNGLLTFEQKVKALEDGAYGGAQWQD